MIEEEAEESLIKAAFAVFSLYTLYQTCPLPNPAPIASETTDQEALNMVPNGLYDRSHPQRSFRRSFKARIRIDRVRYLILLKIREKALAGIAEKQPVSQELVHVMDRLLDGCVQNCEYTGPQSLDALAIHPEYRVFDTDASVTDTPVAPDLAPLLEMAHTVLQQTPAENDGACSMDLQQSLESYEESLSRIRLPVTSSRRPRNVHLRETLLPLFAEDRRRSLRDHVQHDASSVSTLNRSGESVRRRHVSFGPVERASEPGPDAGARDDRGDHAPADEYENDETSSGDLHVQPPINLPTTASKALQASLKAGIRTLLARDRAAFRSHDADDASTLGQSVATDLGIKTLETLFARASADDHFLQVGLDISKTGAAEKNTDDEFDDNVVESAIIDGQTSLDAILVAADAEAKKHAPYRRPASPRKSATKRQRTQRGRKESPPLDDSDSDYYDDSDEEEHHADSSSRASSSAGLHGLEALLARVTK